ncbi:MAG: hypothetical protein LBJ73_01635 [Rickettsiales bacterium]|jgi:hypothetical protein|nr:hypothetical protein [Rickettsiales bacterium]
MNTKIKFIAMLAVSIFGIIFNAGANISSVGYLHKTILDLKNISVPIDSGVRSESVHSVKYMMTQIDSANKLLNGFASSNYAASANVGSIVATTKVESAVSELIKKVSQGFSLQLTNADTFDFRISARGNFSIYWGDGTIDEVNKQNTTNTTYTHNYASAGNYTVSVSGLATEYNTGTSTAAISFGSSTVKTKITGISGSLSNIFPTLANGANPRFYRTFYGCTGLTGSIPPKLFNGLSGAYVANMFDSTFRDCTGLTGSIPPDLFNGLSGAPASYMFNYTFAGCTGLTGKIPAELFKGLSGAPAERMFNSTFSSCTGLSGSIPSGLFSGISGAPASYMFYWTFSGCKGLTGAIPSGLFSGISGAPANQMFMSTFSDCTGLTGAIPAGLFGNISGAPAAYMFTGTFDNCKGLTGKIPSGLFGNISGAPAVYMFSDTFNDCSGLTGEIPSGLFGNLSGAPASNMFSGTFSGCSKLESFGDGIWNLTSVNNSSGNSLFTNFCHLCMKITSASPSIASGSNVKLWQHFTNYSTKAFTSATSLADYADIPSTWK